MGPRERENRLEGVIAQSARSGMDHDRRAKEQLIEELIEEDGKERIPRAPDKWTALMVGDPEPATERQVVELARLRIYIPANVSRQEASAILDRALA